MLIRIWTNIWYRPDHKTKASGVELAEVHGSRKGLDPHRIPERQTQPIVRLEVDRKPRIGQGRAGVRRKVPPLLDSRQRTTASKPIVITDGNRV